MGMHSQHPLLPPSMAGSQCDGFYLGHLFRLDSELLKGGSPASSSALGSQVPVGVVGGTNTLGLFGSWQWAKRFSLLTLS